MTPTDAAERIRRDVERLGARAAEAVEDRLDAAERAMKRTRATLTDARDDTVYRIRRRPLAAIAVAFGAGALLGIAVGWLGRDRER